jgi:hypothetical protein
MRLRHSLIEERTTHKQRIHAQLFHNGYPQQSNLDSTLKAAPVWKVWSFRLRLGRWSISHWR